MENRTASNTSRNQFRIILTGFAISAAVLLLLAGLLVRILVTHKFYLTSDALVTSASLGPTLTIAHACSTVVSTTVPFILGLAAYYLARDWLVASYIGGDNRPTPFQLGMLMSVLHGANLPALWDVCKLMLGFGSAKKAQLMRIPPILRSAVVLLFFYLSLAYGCAISEAWLSATSDAIPLLQTTAYGGSWPLLTRQLNQTRCDFFAANSVLPQWAPLCGTLDGSATTPFGQSEPEGLRTLNNASNLNSAAFADDQTALVVPAPSLIPDNVVFNGSAYGVHATCQSITSQCLNKTDTGPEAWLALNCSTSTIFNFSTPYNATTKTFGALNTSGVILDPNSFGIDSNPFSLAAVVTSFAYVSTSGDDGFVNNTGFFRHGNSGAWNVILCSVDVVSATYQYMNGSFHVRTSSLADLNMTKRIASMIDTNDLTTRVPYAADGAGVFSGDYVTSFGLELSRELAAMSASIYEPGEVSHLVQLVPGIGARLQLAPLVLLLVVLLVYSLSILPMAVLAAIASSSTLYVPLARTRLVEPLTVFHSAFDPEEAHRSWEKSAVNLFSVASEADRLNIGPILTDDGTTAFSVSRKQPV